MLMLRLIPTTVRLLRTWLLWPEELRRIRTRIQPWILHPWIQPWLRILWIRRSLCYNLQRLSRPARSRTITVECLNWQCQCSQIPDCRIFLATKESERK